ncbi:MAG: OmpA family protein [Saprospiraceae bacterium]|nr:OmpA family protein [Saprospiraceae bacterium]
MKKCLPIFYLLLFFDSSAQVPFNWDFGGSLGITSYQGDLDALKVNAGFREIHFSAAGYFRRNLSNNFAVRFNMLAGKLAGDDKNFTEPEWRPLRGIYFESKLLEFTVLSEYYPLGMYPSGVKNLRARRVVSPYVLVGAGWAFVDPMVDWNNNDLSNPELVAKDKSAKTKRAHIVTPVGVGLRFLLKDHSTFSLEAALRPTYSDYLDGVSFVGNPDKPDWFFTAQIGFSYPFDKNKTKNKPIAKKDEKKEPPPPKNRDLFADSDKDGVLDTDDDCPTVPGLRSLRGCPDRDGDGIADGNDKCPDEPGLAEFAGCPDTDDDGVPDKDDKCPDEPGLAAYRGCPPPDRDGDGIADGDDRCPDAPGPVELGGCPDRDGDGIPDKDDKCPDVAGIAEQKGCPALPPPDKAVYFRSSQDTWYRTSDETLDEIVETLKKDPSLKAQISGHTADASDDPSGDVSQRRAKKIYDYLLSKGIAADRLKYQGFGSTRPAEGDILSKDPLLNQQLQRRVEVHFIRQ